MTMFQYFNKWIVTFDPLSDGLGLNEKKNIFLIYCNPYPNPNLTLTWP